MSDISRVPLTALSSEVKHLISTLLNPPKVLPATNGLPRDWRGLAHVCKIGGEVLPAIAFDPDPFNRILTIVQTKSQDFTFKSLKEAMEILERWDILDDTETILERDAELYFERLKRSETTVKENDFLADVNVLTFEDQFRIERGEEMQHYDAFLLYADEDEEFAREMIENLENKNNLKLCLKDRDLIAGITFEHEAIMKLISERCNRLIAIISPEFLESPANKFFINFAQAVGIDKRQERKMIPCVYKNCDLPLQLTYFSKLYYKKISADFFWNKLIRSIKPVQSIENAQKPTKSSNKLKVNSREQTKITIVPKEPEKQEKIQANLLEEKFKSKNTLKTHKLFPWKRKEKRKSTEMPSEGKEVTQEPILNLPSLDGLDTLSTLTSSTTKKSEKKKKVYEQLYEKSAITSRKILIEFL